MYIFIYIYIYIYTSVTEARDVSEAESAAVAAIGDVARDAADIRKPGNPRPTTLALGGRQIGRSRLIAG